MNSPALAPFKLIIPSVNLEIRTRLPEMKANWDAVWEERGSLKPSTVARQETARAQREVQESISDRARNGRRIRDIHKEKGNIYGKIAFERYMRDNQVQVKLEALPKYGVKIDVRIYPPEIKATAKELEP